MRFVRKPKQLTSIIVPVYNAEKYLRECLDSLLAQTSREWEAILVNDGSTDSSPAICEEYAAKDPRIKVVHEDNSGQSSARNTGLRETKGIYVVFLDADDMLHPRFVELMAMMLKDTDADIAQCAYERGRKCHWPQSGVWNADMFSSEEALSSMLYQETISSSACAKIFRARLFENQNFREGLYYEDLELMARLIDETKAKVVSTWECLYFYRANPESFINTLSEKRFDVLKVVDMIEERFAQNPALLKAAQDRKFAANCNIFLLTWRIPIHAHVSHECLKVVRAYRWKILTNRRSRIKNKFGALISYLLFNRFICANNTSQQLQSSRNTALS